MKTRLALLLLAPACLAALACISDAAARLPRRVPPDHTGPYTTWWAEDIKKEEGEYLQGRRHGLVRSYHSTGELAFVGRYENGVPVGEFVHYDEKGGLAATETMAGGARTGPRRVYHDDGSLRAEVHYAEGVKHGAEVHWHPGGKVVRLEGQNVRGVPHGRWRHYDADGVLRTEECFWLRDGQPVGRLETVYDREGGISAQRLVVRRDESWLGRLTMWHDNGVQAGLVEERDGVREGLDVSWDESGRRRIEGRWKADQRDGTWTYWDESGRVQRREAWAGGELAEG